MSEPTPGELNRQWGIPGQIEFQEGPGGLVVAHLTSDDATASVALQGAHVISYVPHGAEPVIFVSAGAHFAPGKAIRGGIPLCWPWFGPHPTDPGKPQHGFVRTPPWSVLATGQDDGAPSMRLGLTDTPTTRALWPHPFALSLTVTVGRDLRVALEVHNPGDTRMECSEALHTYYAIGDITTIAISGLDSVDYVDKVDEGRYKVQAGPITIAGETDRVYLHTVGDITIDDPHLRRRILIAKEGSESTVVWNPWQEKAAAIADFVTEEYHRMVCVEVANALNNTITIPPGGDHRLAMTIRVLRITGE